MRKMTIREAREDMGLTQKDMASKLGISRQGYAYMEAHPENISVATAKSICSILGTEYERLFFSMFAS